MLAASLVGCTGAATGTVEPATSLPATDTAVPPSSTPEREGYGFPNPIDPDKSYLIYLHGKILEDQGIPAISPDYGEYQYEEILERFTEFGFVVISLQRPKNTDSFVYANRVAKQVTTLLQAGVPPEEIIVVGVSKGAGIAVYASYILNNEALTFAILAICHPDYVAGFVQGQVFLVGNILSIYDYKDEYAGSCQELFEYSQGKGIARYDEIVLHIGTGHGILYQPLDEWILPVVQWAKHNAP